MHKRHHEMYSIFNLIQLGSLSCRNDTKEDVFVHQVGACVDIYASDSRLLRGKGRVSSQLIPLIPTGRVIGCLNLFIETYWQFT